MSQKLKVERKGDVLCIGLNRPEKYNAMDVELYLALADAYGELQRDDELRSGLLYGEGQHFCAGLELDKWVTQFANDSFPELRPGACDPFGLDPARRVAKPMVVAAHGICFTAALELMLAADVRVAADDARFGQIEVKRGIYPVGGATMRFPAEVGWGNAMRWLLTGGEFDAAEALRIGLVQEVVEPGRLLDRTVALAEEIAAQAPLGVRATLASARLAREAGEAAAARRLLPDLQPILGSEDAREGLASFMERRAARFQGR
jgi:enoyl-CoA hydratase